MAVGDAKLNFGPGWKAHEVEQGPAKRCGNFWPIGGIALLVGTVVLLLLDLNDHSEASSEAPVASSAVRGPIQFVPDLSHGQQHVVDPPKLRVRRLSTTVPNPSITVPELGMVNGVAMIADNGEEIEGFMGIPYAKPPVGDLRWREPEDVEPWGTLNATAFGATCPLALCGLVESEDCLFMNIYRPRNIGQKKIPVYMYIHGGGWQVGCSDFMPIERHVAAAAAEGKPFIGITINYRLGLLGFLGSEELRQNDTNVSTGNYGLQDQRKAMEFVQKYIKHWGGKKNKVTIGGQSSGAGSVSAHLVMPRSTADADFQGRKLFSGAIVQSGLAPNWNARPMRIATEIYNGLKAFTGCADVACLRQMPPEAFVPFFFSLQDPTTIFEVLPFAPTIDGVELTAHPAELLRTGNFLRVPVLTGSTADEQAFFYALYGWPSPAATEADFDSIVAGYVRQNQTSEDLLALKALYALEAHDYPDDIASSGYSFWWWATMRAVSDNTFVCPSRRGSIWLAGAAEAKRVYNYMLNRRPQSPSLLYPWASGPNLSFVPHGAELYYVFNCTFTAPFCQFTEGSEEALSAKMMASWTEFITKRGKLSGAWKKQRGSSEGERTLLLDVEPDEGSGFVIKKKLREAECNLWEEIMEATLL